LEPFFGIESMETAETMPTHGEMLKLKSLMKSLEKLNSVTIRLQQRDATLDTVRLLFDAVLSQHPLRGKYLNPDADIVHSPNFEHAVACAQQDRL
jgi:hypothetical protein